MISARVWKRYFLAQFLLGAYLILTSARGIAEQTNAPTPAPGYASFVCWKYAKLPQLKAWKETERIIALTLTEAYPALRKLPREENGSPEQLKDFLRQLPDAPGQFHIVYLAAHQSPAGQWVFPDGRAVAWDSLMEGLPKLKSPQRLVLLDSCYAASVNRWPDWSRKIAPACIFAAPENSLTPDLFVFWRRPVDWAVLFPGASRWLRQHQVTASDERISYLGLIWLEAWTKTGAPPQTMRDWRSFAETMTEISRHASTQINAEDVSAISSVFPPD